MNKVACLKCEEWFDSIEEAEEHVRTDPRHKDFQQRQEEAPKPKRQRRKPPAKTERPHLKVRVRVNTGSLYSAGHWVSAGTKEKYNNRNGRVTRFVTLSDGHKHFEVELDRGGTVYAVHDQDLQVIG